MASESGTPPLFGLSAISIWLPAGTLTSAPEFLQEVFPTFTVQDSRDWGNSSTTRLNVLVSPSSSPAAVILTARSVALSLVAGESCHGGFAAGEQPSVADEIPLTAAHCPALWLSPVILAVSTPAGLPAPFLLVPPPTAIAVVPPATARNSAALAATVE